jgi:hypothetical protein
MIKYKEAGNDWFIKIFLDEKGEESSRTPSFCKKSSPGLYAEMEAWQKAGGVIEPQFTETELEAKAAKEAEDAIENQKQTLLSLISSNEYHLISRRFAGDLLIWETALDKWAAQLEEVKAGKLVEIEPVPVFD